MKILFWAKTCPLDLPILIPICQQHMPLRIFLFSIFSHIFKLKTYLGIWNVFNKSLQIKLFSSSRTVWYNTKFNILLCSWIRSSNLIVKFTPWDFCQMLGLLLVFLRECHSQHALNSRALSPLLKLKLYYIVCFVILFRQLVYPSNLVQCCFYSGHFPSRRFLVNIVFQWPAMRIFLCISYLFSSNSLKLLLALLLTFLALFSFQFLVSYYNPFFNLSS